MRLTLRRYGSTGVYGDYLKKPGVAGGQTVYGGDEANDDLILHGTAHATKTSSYVLLQPSGGKVGIGTSTPLAALHVGTGTANNSSDSQILISRAVDSTTAGNGHAFSDSSAVNRPGTVEYNSYDARITITGSHSYDHYAAFQSLPVISTSGGLTNHYGFYDGINRSGGAVTNRYGAYIAAPILSSGASITSQYGVYVDALSQATSNYALYTNAGLVRLGDIVQLANGRIRPTSDSATAFQFQNAAGSSSVVVINTTTPQVNVFAPIAAGANSAILGLILLKATYNDYPAQALITTYSAGAIGVSQYMYQNGSTTWRSAFSGAISRGAALQAQGDFVVITAPVQDIALGDALTTQPTTKFQIGESGVALFGVTPVARSTGWAATNVTTDKIFNANATTLDEVADVLGTLINYLISRGDLSA